ncbi:MAG: hypothetical protein ACKV22_29295 [Bryobacteraceae bacterium]
MKLLQSAVLVVAGALGAVLIMQFTNRPPAPAPVPAMAEAVPAQPISTEPLAVATPVVPQAAEAPAPKPKTVVSSRPAPKPVSSSSHKPAKPIAPEAAEAPKPTETAASNQSGSNSNVVRYPVFPPEPVAKAEPVTAPPPLPPKKVVLAAGMLIPIRLNESLSTDRNNPGDTFTAVLDQELVVDGFVIAERGARAEGRVLNAAKAGKVKGLSMISLQLMEIVTSDGQRVEVETEPFEKSGPTSKGEDAAKVGGGAGIGAAIGGIAGGGKGAALGAIIGAATGGGAVAATRGKPARIEAETRIPFRLRSSVTVTEKRKS